MSAAPQTLDETDALRLELADTRLALQRARLEAAQRERQAVLDGLTAKYRLVPGDSLNLATRTIARAAKED